MRAVTHYVFSAGLVLYLLSYVRALGAESLLVGLWLSFAVNATIDGLGHRSRGGRPVRSWTTHSVVTAPLWGVLTGAASILAVEYLGGGSSGQALLLWAGVGAAVALGHLFLDSVTEGGVFWVTRRAALAHYKYNNRLLNGAFVLIGLLLAASALA